MAVQVEGLGDDLTNREVDRLLAENVALRSKAKEVARRLCHLEKMLVGRHDALLLFKDRIKAIDTGEFELSTEPPEFHPNDILRLSNENSCLRSEISLAELEIFQIELTIESKQYLLHVNTESKIARLAAKEQVGPSIAMPTTTPRSKNNGHSSFSETSEVEFPRIKAVFARDSRGHIQDGTCTSSRRPRSRAQSNASSVSWCSNPPKSDTRPRVSNKSGQRPAGKKSSPFMGCNRCTNVDSSSAAFFGSLRS